MTGHWRSVNNQQKYARGKWKENIGYNFESQHTETRNKKENRSKGCNDHKQEHKMEMGWTHYATTYKKMDSQNDVLGLQDWSVKHWQADNSLRR